MFPLRDVVPASPILLVAAAGLVIGLGAVLAALRPVRRRQTELARKLRELERLFDERDAAGHSSAAPVTAPARVALPEPLLQVGALGPDFTVTGPPGERIRRDDLAFRGRSLLLVFVSRSGPCQDVLGQAAAWATRLAPSCDLLVIAQGSADENLSMVRSFADLPLGFAGTAAVAEAYDAAWTPAALVLDRHARVSVPAVFGGDAIARLVDRLADGAGDTGTAAATPLPAFEAITAGGDVVRSASLVGADGLAILYWNAGCPYCDALVSSMRTWTSRRPAHAPNLVVPARSAAQVVESFGAAVVIDPDGSLCQTLGLSGTPSALFFDDTGVSRSAPLVGTTSVMQLLGLEVPPPPAGEA